MDGELSCELHRRAIVRVRKECYRPSCLGGMLTFEYGEVSLNGEGVIVAMLDRQPRLASSSSSSIRIAIAIMRNAIQC